MAEMEGFEPSHRINSIYNISSVASYSLLSTSPLIYSIFIISIDFNILIDKKTFSKNIFKVFSCFFITLFIILIDFHILIRTYDFFLNTLNTFQSDLLLIIVLTFLNILRLLYNLFLKNIK